MACFLRLGAHAQHRGQISQHNHRINDEIYSFYSNNSAVPEELLIGAQVEEPQAPDPSARSFGSEEAGSQPIVDPILPRERDRQH